MEERPEKLRGWFCLAKIEDVCEILDYRRVPVTASNRIPGPYPYYGANGVQDYVSDFIFDDELVLLAEDGGNFGSKERPIACRVSGKCWVNNHAHVLKPKPGLNVDYLCYSLMFYDVSGIVNGSTRQKLTQADMRQMEIPLRKMSEQKHIVSVLNAVEQLITRHKQQIAKLDELVKARFVEMFGDPEGNPHICLSIVRGPFGSMLKKDFFVPRSNSTYKIYEQKHAIQKSASIGSYYITEEKYNELKRFECFPGDIIMSCSGTMGEFYQLPIDCERGVINQALCKFTLNQKKVLPIIFLVYMREAIERLETKDSAIQNIAAVSYVKALPFILPPMGIQHEYEAYFERAERSKSLIQMSIMKLNTLKALMMQKYFGNGREE